MPEAKNYSFGQPTLGRGKPEGLATPGSGNRVHTTGGRDAPKVAGPGGSQKSPKVASKAPTVARPGGAQKVGK